MLPANCDEHLESAVEQRAACRSTRILFVDQTAQLGGAELCLRDLVLARRAQDTVLLLQDGPLAGQLREAKVDVQIEPLGKRSHSLRKESGLFGKAVGSFDVMRVARRVAKAAKGCDLIYANTPKALVVCALAGLAARRPVIYHLHDILSREHFSRSNLWLLKTLANGCVSHVIVNSHATENAFRLAGGRTPSSVCYNGFDSRTFDEHTRDRERHSAAVRQSRKIAADVPLAAVFGRFAPWKGQHVAIEALRRLPNFHLLLVGDALFGENRYKQELIEAGGRADVAGRVHFLGFREDVAAIMQAADVVVHCSTAPEPFGRVIVEAMLSRRPVVAARGGGAQEIVEHGVTGLLSEPGNAQQLAEHLATLLASTERPQTMVRAAYASAKERFELASVTEQLESIVRSVVH